MSIKRALLYFCLIICSSCSSKSEEGEPDYDNMVMIEEEEWITDEERDRKIIAKDPPDPQELLILESPEIVL